MYGTDRHLLDSYVATGFTSSGSIHHASQENHAINDAMCLPAWQAKHDRFLFFLYIYIQSFAVQISCQNKQSTTDI